jgi:hypothetical protein
VIEAQIAKQVGSRCSIAGMDAKISLQDRLSERLLDEGLAITIFLESKLKVGVERFNGSTVVGKNLWQTVPRAERLVEDPGDVSSVRRCRGFRGGARQEPCTGWVQALAVTHPSPRDSLQVSFSRGRSG